MTDRPILFSGTMIRALLAGRKTQTRRVLPVQPTSAVMDVFKVATEMATNRAVFNMRGHDGKIVYGLPVRDGLAGEIVARYGIGDRLWVRETFSNRRPEACDRSLVWHMADSPWRHEDRVHWKPSIHMPRWASRLTLAITDVRVQRLADLSEEDALAEGVCVFTEDLDRGAPWGDMTPADRAAMVRNTYGSAVTAYRHLWETINGAGSWERNPWVVALTFEVHQANIAEMEKATA